mgnify:CR=1 FL=1
MDADVIVVGAGIAGLVAACELAERGSSVLLLDQEDWRRCEPTILNDYVYRWPEEGRPRAVSLGVGSLFNASDAPNVDVEIDVAAKTLTFRAIRPVEPGQELVLDYGWGAGAADRIRGGKSRPLHAVG